MSIVRDARMREWEGTVPREIRDDPIWEFHTHRVALYLLHLALEDAGRAGARYAGVRDQLVRSVATVSTNIAEGCGRATPRDRTRFYDVALGALREALTWYGAARAFLPEDTIYTRIEQFSELRRMLFGAIRALRAISPGLRITG